MKRSLSYYLSRGMSDTKWGFKFIPLSQRLLLLVYGFVGFFGKLFFFSRPFFTLAESQLVSLMNQRKPFNVWQMFDQVVSREQYNRLMVSYFIMDLMTLFVGSLLALIPLFIWFYVTPLLNNFEQTVGLFNVLVVYFISLGIVGLLFAFSFYRPFAFVTILKPNLQSGSILTTTHQVLKKQHKVTVFVLNFIYFLFLYFLVFTITIQGSIVLYGSIVINFGFVRFLPSLIFAIVFLVAFCLMVIWILPLSYVLLIATQHHLLIDSIASSETPSQQPPSTNTNSPEGDLVLPVLEVNPEHKDEKQDTSDKKVTGKLKRKSS